MGRAAPLGSVMGVGLSSSMLRRATELAAAEGVANVRFERVDTQVHPFAPAASTSSSGSETTPRTPSGS